MKNDEVEFSAATKLQRELWLVVDRYGQESDVTVYEALGALEMCKVNLANMLNKIREK